MMRQVQVYENVLSKFRYKYENDLDFNNELDDLIIFYGRKLLSLTNVSTTREMIESSIENVIKNQYFHGCYTMTKILADNEIEFDDKTWSLPKGILQNEVRVFINKLFIDIDIEFDWADNNVINQFGLQMLKELEFGFDVVEVIKYEVAAFGAYKALLEDPRYKGPQNKATEDMLLGNPFDVEFINFQVFMQAQFYSSEHELWDLFEVGKGIQDNVWCGTAHLSSIPQNNDEKSYILSINLLNTIRPEERMLISESIAKRLPDYITDSLQIRLYHTTEMEFLTLHSKED